MLIETCSMLLESAQVSKPSLSNDAGTELKVVKRASETSQAKQELPAAMIERPPPTQPCGSPAPRHIATC